MTVNKVVRNANIVAADTALLNAFEARLQQVVQREAENSRDFAGIKRYGGTSDMAGHDWSDVIMRRGNVEARQFSKNVKISLADANLFTGFTPGSVRQRVIVGIMLPTGKANLPAVTTQI